MGRYSSALTWLAPAGIVFCKDFEAIELPFLEIDEELWDPAMMRLTLFIDPGRIKRGAVDEYLAK